MQCKTNHDISFCMHHHTKCLKTISKAIFEPLQSHLPIACKTLDDSVTLLTSEFTFSTLFREHHFLKLNLKLSARYQVWVPKQQQQQQDVRYGSLNKKMLDMVVTQQQDIRYESHTATRCQIWQSHSNKMLDMAVTQQQDIRYESHTATRCQI